MRSLADCDFNRAAPHPADPIKCHMSTERTQTPDSVDIAHHRAVALDPLENTIGQHLPLRGAWSTGSRAPFPVIRGTTVRLRGCVETGRSAFSLLVSISMLQKDN